MHIGIIGLGKMGNNMRARLKKKGVEIVALEDLDTMKQKVSGIVGQWSEKSPLIAEFVKAASA